MEKDVVVTFPFQTESYKDVPFLLYFLIQIESVILQRGVLFL